MLALDLQLDSSMRDEARGEVMPLALRRFQNRWESRDSASAIQQATAAVLTTYHQLFPSASPVVRVSRLCDIVGVHLTGLRPGSRATPSYAVADSSSRHVGHSGSVRFSRQGMPSIQIPEGVDGYRARVAAAHEIGHVLVHKRGDGYDEVTTRLPTSVQEEAIAEYAARLLLLSAGGARVRNLAERAVRWASDAEVTVHAATCRLGDPDQSVPLLRGAVLWKMNPRARSGSTLAERLTPAWHLCPGAFVPIGRCKARPGSLVTDVASEPVYAGSVRTEDVHIGSLSGTFRVHAFSWGSVAAGTRLVLSVFKSLAEARSQDSEISSSDKVSGSNGALGHGVNLCGSEQRLLGGGWF